MVGTQEEQRLRTRVAWHGEIRENDESRLDRLMLQLAEVFGTKRPGKRGDIKRSAQAGKRAERSSPRRCTKPRKQVEKYGARVSSQ